MSLFLRFGIKLKWKLWKIITTCDVLLLAHVFEKYKNSSLKNYGLCPKHYLSATALSWDAMLNMTEVKLELISDADVYLFFEKGIRGGVSCISKWYNKQTISI